MLQRALAGVRQTICGCLKRRSTIYSYVEWFVAGADGVVCEVESNAIIVVFVVYSNRNGGMGFLRGPETYTAEKMSCGGRDMSVLLLRSIKRSSVRSCRVEHERVSVCCNIYMLVYRVPSA